MRGLGYRDSMKNAVHIAMWRSEVSEVTLQECIPTVRRAYLWDRRRNSSQERVVQYQHWRLLSVSAEKSRTVDGVLLQWLAVTSTGTTNSRLERKDRVLCSHTFVQCPPGLQRLWCRPSMFRIAKPEAYKVASVLCQLPDMEEWEPETAYCCSGLSLNPSLAWKMLKLLAYCTSPFLKPRDTACFSARKCNVSRASACASVMGGMSEDRGKPQ